MLSCERRAIGFLARHLLAGSIGGFVLGGLILWTDTFGLASLIFASSQKTLALVMMFFGLFITFGGTGMAWGVMGLGEERDSDPL